MIPATNVRTVATRGVSAGAEFGISLADSAHIMTILRDTLYSDKILAVLREYSANAWDSHRTSGKANLPIKVQLPTFDEPTLMIRDFGRGLSRDEVFNVYTQYGASTKRDQDLAVGMLGIGSKSGFAYSDTFTVVSRFGGVKSAYTAMLDPSDKGLISLIGEEPCGDETGITIEIPVKTEDIDDFMRKASGLFIHFDPRPDINVQLTPPPSVLGKFKSGTLYTGNNGDYDYNNPLTAVMGCVPYRINLSQVENFEEGIPSFMRNLKAALLFDIGEVHINASREELKYSDKTKRAIIDKLNKLVEEYVTSAVQCLRDPAVLPWNRRLAAQHLRDFGAFVPKDVKLYTDYSLQIDDKIPTAMIPSPTDPAGEKVQIFWLSGNKTRNRVSNISVRSDARIVIKDDGRSLRGFGLGSYDIVVNKGRTGATIPKIMELLDVVLAEVEATGITILKTSEMKWTPAVSTHGYRPPNMKHAVKSFRYTPVKKSYSYRSNNAPSASWEIVDRVPTDGDVYVEITHFASIDVDLEDHYFHDKTLAEEYGITMPEVYGYKVTEKEPSKLRTGITYREWRTVMAGQIMADPRFQEMVATHNWDEILGSYARQVEPADLAVLGKDNVVYKFFKDRKHFKSSKTRLVNESMINRVERIIGKIDPALLPATARLQEVREKYPLFSCEGFNLDKIGVESDLPKWIGYMQLVDAQGAAKP